MMDRQTDMQTDRYVITTVALYTKQIKMHISQHMKLIKVVLTSGQCKILEN